MQRERQERSRADFSWLKVSNAGCADGPTAEPEMYRPMRSTASTPNQHRLDLRPSLCYQAKGHGRLFSSNHFLCNEVTVATHSIMCAPDFMDRFQFSCSLVYKNIPAAPFHNAGSVRFFALRFSIRSLAFFPGIANRTLYPVSLLMCSRGPNPSNTALSFNIRSSIVSMRIGLP